MTAPKFSEIAVEISDGVYGCQYERWRPVLTGCHRDLDRDSSGQTVVQVMLVGGLFVPLTVPMNPKLVEPPAGSAPL